MLDKYLPAFCSSTFANFMCCIQQNKTNIKQKENKEGDYKSLMYFLFYFYHCYCRNCIQNSYCAVMFFIRNHFPLESICVTRATISGCDDFLNFNAPHAYLSIAEMNNGNKNDENNNINSNVNNSMNTEHWHRVRCMTFKWIHKVDLPLLVVILTFL